jgi:hypothetical protein
MPRRLHRAAVFAAAALLAIAAHGAALAQDVAPHGISIAAIDPAVAPGDDFFAYANGAWIARTTTIAAPTESARPLWRPPTSGCPA